MQQKTVVDFKDLSAEEKERYFQILQQNNVVFQEDNGSEFVATLKVNPNQYQQQIPHQNQQIHQNQNYQQTQYLPNQLPPQQDNQQNISQFNQQQTQQNKPQQQQQQQFQYYKPSAPLKSSSTFFKDFQDKNEQFFQHKKSSNIPIQQPQNFQYEQEQEKNNLDYYYPQSEKQSEQQPFPTNNATNNINQNYDTNQLMEQESSLNQEFEKMQELIAQKAQQAHQRQDQHIQSLNKNSQTNLHNMNTNQPKNNMNQLMQQSFCQQEQEQIQNFTVKNNINQNIHNLHNNNNSKNTINNNFFPNLQKNRPDLFENIYPPQNQPINKVQQHPFSQTQPLQYQQEEFSKQQPFQGQQQQILQMQQQQAQSNKQLQFKQQPQFQPQQLQQPSPQFNPQSYQEQYLQQQPLGQNQNFINNSNSNINNNQKQNSNYNNLSASPIKNQQNTPNIQAQIQQKKINQTPKQKTPLKNINQNKQNEGIQKAKSTQNLKSPQNTRNNVQISKTPTRKTSVNKNTKINTCKSQPIKNIPIQKQQQQQQQQQQPRTPVRGQKRVNDNSPLTNVQQQGQKISPFFSKSQQNLGKSQQQQKSPKTAQKQQSGMGVTVVKNMMKIPQKQNKLQELLQKYPFLPKILTLIKDPNTRPCRHPKNVLIKIIEEIYSQKFQKNSQQLLSGKFQKKNCKSEYPFSEFIHKYFLDKYKNAKQAQTQFLNFIASVDYHKESNNENQDEWLQIFLKFLTNEYKDQEQLVFYLFIRSMIEKELKRQFFDPYHTNTVPQTPKDQEETMDPTNTINWFMTETQYLKVSQSVFGEHEEQLVESFMNYVKSHVIQTNKVNVYQFLQLSIQNYLNMIHSLTNNSQQEQDEEEEKQQNQQQQQQQQQQQMSFQQNNFINHSNHENDINPQLSFQNQNQSISKSHHSSQQQQQQQEYNNHLENNNTFNEQLEFTLSDHNNNNNIISEEDLDYQEQYQQYNEKLQNEQNKQISMSFNNNSHQNTQQKSDLEHILDYSNDQSRGQNQMQNTINSFTISAQKIDDEFENDQDSMAQNSYIKQQLKSINQSNSSINNLIIEEIDEKILQFIHMLQEENGNNNSENDYSEIQKILKNKTDQLAEAIFSCDKLLWLNLLLVDKKQPSPQQLEQIENLQKQYRKITKSQNKVSEEDQNENIDEFSTQFLSTPELVKAIGKLLACLQQSKKNQNIQQQIQ